MNILYIGDVMGGQGREAVKRVLPELRQELAVDMVIAQGENVSHGKSMTPRHMRELQHAGVNFFTGGNHTLKLPEIHDLIANPSEPVICPANLKGHPTEWGVKSFTTPNGPVLVISLLGQTFPKNIEIYNPLGVLDEILARHSLLDYAAVIVNFHGDFSSEKRVIGYYGDGRVTAVVGDHWHVPTADAMVLPGGTAHITDVGMCGVLHSSLGVELDMIIKRWRDEVPTPNSLAHGGELQFNAVLIETNAKTKLASRITQIQKILEN